MFQDWDALIELYSLGKLTYHKDKLFALSGIAKVVSIAEGGTDSDGYLAGLWQTSLPLRLLWHTEVVGTADAGWGKGSWPKRHSVYIAPSWSWASVDGKVSFAWCRRNYNLKDHLVTLEHAQISPLGLDRFGGVEAGMLQLRGPLARCYWRSTLSDGSIADDKTKYGVVLKIAPFDASVEAVRLPFTQGTEIHFDVFDEDQPEQLTLLPIVFTAYTDLDGSETMLGLVLHERRHGVFERLGVFRSVDSHFCKMRHAPQQSIMLI